MMSSKAKRITIALIIPFLLGSCLEKEFEELQEEIILDNPDLQTLIVTDPSIWNSLATQAVSDTDSTDESTEKSATKEKEYPGDDMYYYTLFEDLYPGVGDYDFNDIILKTRLFIQKRSGIYSGTIMSELVHRGGSITTKLGVMFYDTDGKGNYQRIPNEDITINGVELDEGGHPYTILLPSETDNKEWEIGFSCPKGKKGKLWISYFLITNKADADTQILTSGFAAVTESQDFQIPASDYLSKDNKPWGLEIEAKEMPIVNEKENFCKAFPDFAFWVQEPDNSEYEDWFERPDPEYIQGTK